MKAFMIVLTCILMAVTPGVNADDNLGSHAEQVMKPLVRVKTSMASGSGTVLYSEDREKSGEFRTFILTNHHVVGDAIHVRKKWDNLTGSWIYTEENEQVTVELFTYLRNGKTVTSLPIKADIVAYKAEEDLALLELDYPVQVMYVAEIIPDEHLPIKMLQEVWAVGSSLGVDPIATNGHIMDLEFLIERKTYIMASAEIIYGNSGGAVFTRIGDKYYFVGVPSRIRVNRGQALTHMGYFIPPERVKSFFKTQKLDFLLDSEKTPTESFKEREELKIKTPAFGLGAGADRSRQYEHDEDGAEYTVPVIILDKTEKSE